MAKTYNTLRLILGDQLNRNHSWFSTTCDETLYVLMEVRTETDYTWHHIQKIAAFFCAMRGFANYLKESGHQVRYFRLSDADNLQDIPKNCGQLIKEHHIKKFEYLLPDEYRVDEILKNFCDEAGIETSFADTEHFYTHRSELAEFFKYKEKGYLMESFYRYMRKKHNILMKGDEPLTGQWNYDHDNRKKLPAGHKPVNPLVFDNDVSDIVDEILSHQIVTIGSVDKKHLIWPVNREQALELLAFFCNECLSLFGTFQDAMMPGEWSVYHSRLSFCLNTKMISPHEVIASAIKAWEGNKQGIAYNQLEGFVRQILGWREYMRGIYWLKMPEFETLNFLEHNRRLPAWYWTGETRMNCLRDAIKQSLQFAYAHHIQRLMVTGNFALLAGILPDDVDQWYLGIYIDAIHWVELTNTRGMSQFADGGLVGTKPYVSSANYINNMSHYCTTCYYDPKKRTGDKACPFNSLYWNFYDRHRAKLEFNPRIGMAYKTWDKMDAETKSGILLQADIYLENLEKI
ncbi:cryptochrome/photolyase family protein [Flavobacterium cyanobacteriorum]|uniref:Cryptochrome/photolyase family protein n=1 Tax=Flavobacterium cyanobacteriorum TaxID=2022802 RepID=A0A255ZNP4_9FLAO|nr:cryptochrome/photolyase family protein [Flavobacterium cyanobacteriorum]OYQ43076.1 cryptochrome/photolyase family protein [Flavobacterium cyanobacteriorum]